VRWILGLLAFFFATTASAETPPQRIVSANLCADRLILDLADRDRIVSLSKFASDPALSTVADKVGDLPLNHADAEEIASMHPDLVVFGQYTQKAASDMLKALGYSVYMLPHPRDLDGMRKVIRDLAARLGETERGEAMIQSIDADLSSLKPHRPARAVFYAAGGWTSGKPSMAEDLLSRLGATNVASAAGIGSAGALPLEKLIAAGPDLIVVETMGENEPRSLATALLDHPTLSGRGIRRLDMPMKYWDCADRSIVDAARLIEGALP
jgi:iron complex transport system substrate-binding protein